MRTGFYFFLLWLLSITVPAVGSDNIKSLSPQQSDRSIITGCVYDSVSQDVVPYVTIQVLGTNYSTLSNEDGQYRLILDSGAYRLKFSHVGYSSDTAEILLTADSLRLDMKLTPVLIELPGTRVYSRAYDPGQQIIIEAIRRKKDILSQLHDYRFEAYTKLVVNDLKKDSGTVFLITESQVTSYWQYPNKYKEVITARKQSSNLPPEANLVAVGEILNFNQNRIIFGDYSVVTPTARDALDYYNYYLLDTIYVEGKPVFRLEIEPKNRFDPLFVGSIHIADTTFDVVAVDVGFSEGVTFPMVSNIRYRQDFAMINDKYWMPVKIVFSGEVTFNVRIPGIPAVLSFEHMASLYNYAFETGATDGIFDEYNLVVADEADDIDSAVWFSRQTIPLTDKEIYGYRRIDSIQNLPRPLYKRILALGLGSMVFLALGGEYDLFHYNRVEGPYLGMRLNLDKLIPQTQLWLKTGYSFEQEQWQHRYGFHYEFWEKQKMSAGLEYKDLVENFPNQSGYNPTFLALLAKYDQFDYYHEKGWHLFGGMKLLNHTRLNFGYYDYNQYPLEKTTDYSLLRNDELARLNPPARQGKLRSVYAAFSYDSRMRYKSKQRDIISSAPQYTRLETRVEYADPDFIDNDFDFSRYTVSLYRRQRLFSWGYSSLYLYGGASEKTLPPQKYYTVDFGNEVFATGQGFNTLNETNFYGDRFFMVMFNHEFGRYLFYQSGLPLIKKIPFTLAVHAGAFWTELDEDKKVIGDYCFPMAITAYSELGFSLGNLTPFMSPFNLMLDFTWQVSDYETSNFSLEWWFTF